MTEEEAFAAEEKRFELLADRFKRVWLRDGDYLERQAILLRKGVFRIYANVVNDDDRYEYGIWLFGNIDASSELEALRALNDRIDLAFQGKVKGE